jgi:hypothetical protein
VNEHEPQAASETDITAFARTFARTLIADVLAEPRVDTMRRELRLEHMRREINFARNQQGETS